MPSLSSLMVRGCVIVMSNTPRGGRRWIARTDLSIYSSGGSDDLLDAQRHGFFIE
jgi:hypothetical protein